MSKQVDSFKYVPFIIRKLMQGWCPKPPVTDIPWTPLDKPLAECRLALISSAALTVEGQEPFDQQGERERPWWGDPSFRKIPRDTRAVKSHHLHINTRYVEQDLNSVFPLHRLIELAEKGKVGSVAETHYSFMGYILDETELLASTAPAIIEGLHAEEVDAVVLVPV